MNDHELDVLRQQQIKLIDWAGKLALPTDSWLQTNSGQKVFLLDHSNDAECLKIADIAHALSRIPRFNGHSMHNVNVAWHSCLVSGLMEMLDRFTIRRWPALCGLLHDAAEAFTGDVVSPFKRMLPDYRSIQSYMENRIYFQFGLTHDQVELFHPMLKENDTIALGIERKLFLSDESKKLWGLDLPYPYLVDQLRSALGVVWEDDPERDAWRFEDRYDQLKEAAA